MKARPMHAVLQECGFRTSDTVGQTLDRAKGAIAQLTIEDICRFAECDSLATLALEEADGASGTSVFGRQLTVIDASLDDSTEGTPWITYQDARWAVRRTENDAAPLTGHVHQASCLLAVAAMTLYGRFDSRAVAPAAHRLQGFAEDAQTLGADVGYLMRLITVFDATGDLSGHTIQSRR